MKCCKIILIMVLAIAGCKRQPSPDQSSGDQSGMSFLALGDSYTIGESVGEKDRWPVLLAGALTKNGHQVKSPYIIATTGWTTGDLLLALQNYHPAENFGMVSLLIGVNNQYQGRSLDEYRTEFRALLLKCIAYAGGDASRVFVLSIPDWGVTPFGLSNREKIGREIDAFNAVALDECKKQNVLFVDVTTLSRNALADPSLIAKDNLHFSGKMYQQWVDAIVPKIKVIH